MIEYDTYAQAECCVYLLMGQPIFILDVVSQYNISLSAFSIYITNSQFRPLGQKIFLKNWLTEKLLLPLDEPTHLIRLLLILPTAVTLK